MASSWNLFLFFLSIGRNWPSEAVAQRNPKLNCFRENERREVAGSRLEELRSIDVSYASQWTLSMNAGGMGVPQGPPQACEVSHSQRCFSLQPRPDTGKYTHVNQIKERQEELLAAAGRGDVATVRRLAADGANVEARDAHGDSPLHVAARHAHLGVLAALLEAGARAGARGSRLRTPLHWAAAGGSLEAVERLLVAGAPSDVTDAAGATPLALAVRANHSEVVLRLARPDAALDVADARGDTALVRAARAGDWAWAGQLARLGASPTRRGAGGDSALVLAARAGRADALQDMLGTGGVCDASEMARALTDATSPAGVWVLAEAAPDLAVGEAGTEGLRRAASNPAACNEDLLVAFLNLGVDPNAANGEKTTATLLAAELGHVTCVNALRKRGANPLAGSTVEDVLRQEAQKCRYEFVAALLAAGVDVNCRNEGNESALLFAAESGHLRCVQLLRKHGADPLRDPQYVETLSSAAQNGNRSAIAVLLAAGVNPNARNKNEKKALLLAAQKGHLEIVQDLLLYGAEKLQGDEGGNELNTACSSNQAKIAKSLLAAGAAYGRRNYEGEGPIHDAAQAGCIECIQALLDAGENVNAVDKSGESALHEAAFYGKNEVIDFLLRTGASVNSKDNVGETPLHECAQGGHRGCIQILLAGGADTKAVGNKKENPCHDAASASQANSLRELVRADGGCVNSANIYGQTPLHSAASKSCEECIKILIEGKVDINRRDNNNDTALHIVVRKGCENCAKVLIRNGGNATLPNSKGETALALASSEVMREILKN